MSDLDDILYQLGVYPTQRGYHITAVAVAIGRQEPEKLQMLTKWLYPAVALRCSCSSAAVERNLRATANRAWDTNSKLVSQIASESSPGPPLLGTSCGCSAGTCPRRRKEREAQTGLGLL